MYKREIILADILDSTNYYVNYFFKFERFCMLLKSSLDRMIIMAIVCHHDLWLTNLANELSFLLLK